MSDSPTIDVLLAAGIEPTLDAWLAFNEATGTFDAELLDILPTQFHEEYIERCKMNADNEKKWEAQQLQALGTRVDQGRRTGLYSAHRG